MSHQEYPEDISKHGFSSGSGRFKAWPGGMERIPGTRLRRMFLPRLSREAKKALQQNREFVRCQLKHYDIRYRGEEYSGNGTQLLQKYLKARKCDQVPRYILELEDYMHRIWVNSCGMDVLMTNPNWFMDKHFLTYGRPDPLRTITVITVKPGTFDSKMLIAAVAKIEGLYCQEVVGPHPESKAIFMGWNALAVEQTAKEHLASEMVSFMKEALDGLQRRLEESKIICHKDPGLTCSDNLSIENSRLHDVRIKVESRS